MRALILKLGATVLTVGATTLSALYVTAHLKNPGAPLQPAVLASGQGTTVSALGGSVVVGPSVKPGQAQPVTSTYAS
jgi:hypothetical protein